MVHIGRDELFEHFKKKNIRIAMWTCCSKACAAGKAPDGWKYKADGQDCATHCPRLPTGSSVTVYPTNL
jgi:hypothetical protein